MTKLTQNDLDTLKLLLEKGIDRKQAGKIMGMSAQFVGFYHNQGYDLQKIQENMVMRAKKARESRKYLTKEAVMEEQAPEAPTPSAPEEEKPAQMTEVTNKYIVDLQVSIDDLERRVTRLYNLCERTHESVTTLLESTPQVVKKGLFSR